MLEGKRVAVVVPAHDEERLVIDTLGGIPDLVDRVYVVDDASADATAENAGSVGDPRVEVIRHERNLGVGAAIVAGYRRAATQGNDGSRRMAGGKPMESAGLAGPGGAGSPGRGRGCAGETRLSWRGPGG